MHKLIDSVLTRIRCRSPIIVNSLPKSGTNLLAKAVRYLPSLRGPVFHLGGPGMKGAEPADEPTAPVGVDLPTRAPIKSLERILDKVEPRHFLTAHVPYSPQFSSLLDSRNFKKLIIIRDPRDVILSHSHFINKNTDHPLHPSYAKKSRDDRIEASIKGFDTQEGETLQSIGSRYRSVLSWNNTRCNLTVRFEDLIGPSGGGDSSRQCNTLLRIADHLQVSCSRTRAKSISESLFGGTSTFEAGRGGSVNSWHGEYSNRHRDLINEEVGDILIEMGYEDSPEW